MAGKLVRHLILAGFAASALGGCVPGLGKKDTTEEAGTPLVSFGKGKSQERDVEAPEVFQTTDMALWDGRPSLGGVWVASPDAKDPERVMIRNLESGKSVVGALFRRERDNPGPKLQISSDAASALGLLAGQPGKISVTALKRSDTAPAEEKPAAEPAAAAEAAPAKPEATAKPVAEEKPAPTAKAPAAAKAAPAPAQPPVQPGAPIPAGTIAERTLPTAAPAAAASATKPPAAAPAVKPEPSQKPEPAAKTAAATSATHSVQIGIFSQEANAKTAADKLGKAGLPVVISKGQTQGKDHWSVTASGSDAEALLAKVKGLGFTDAYKIK